MLIFSRPLIYVQVSTGSATALRVGTTDQITVTSSALAHPRTLMGEFNGVQSCLRQLIEGLGLRQWNVRAPNVIVHLIPKVEGGYTNVELRAFREAMHGAGAGQVHLLVDHPPLTQAQQAEFNSFFSKSAL